MAGTHLPKPIRFDGDTWLCMRNDPALPKAIIRRFRDVKRGAVFLVIRWALDPAEQQLMASAPTLERANELVRFDPPTGFAPGFNGYPHSNADARRESQTPAAPTASRAAAPAGRQ